MDYRIKNVKHKISNIRKSLKVKDRMNKFEYKFANSLFNNIKNSLDSETDNDFTQFFYNGEPCKNRFLYDTILNFNFYKDNVNQILSNHFRSSIVTNELKKMLIESNINICNLSYQYDEALFCELNKNKENSNDDKNAVIEVRCILEFNYLSFIELLEHRIMKNIIY